MGLTAHDLEKIIMANGNGHKHPICERLRRIAVGRQVGMNELARRAGLSPGHLYNILKGRIRSPWFSTVVRILVALDAEDISVIEQHQRPRRKSAAA